jgi:hypothetical protein
LLRVPGLGGTRVPGALFAPNRRMMTGEKTMKPTSMISASGTTVAL